MVERFAKYNPIGGAMSTPLSTSSTDLTDSPAKPINRRRHHGRLFWTEICWRLMATLIFSIAITIILYSFSLKGILSRWEKRWSNALAILFSSLVSLSTGSLLGLLGTMLRWPLLARKLHTPVDVDLILGMYSPTGALRLIWVHTVHKRKWCFTTVVVLVYLLANIIGQLSVAAFGLTFDLNQQPGIEYPASITNWNTTDWYNDTMLQTADDEYGFLSQNLQRMNRYATIGLSNVPGGDFDSKNISTYNATNINGHGLNRMINGDRVTYSYYLKEYRGEEVNSSKTNVLHSSSKCIGETVSRSPDGEMQRYPGGDTTDETFITVLKNILNIYQASQDDIIWTAPLHYGRLNEGSECARTYIYTESYEGDAGRNRNVSLFQCDTCTSHNTSIPGLGLLELSHSTTHNISNLVHRISSFDRVWGPMEEGSHYTVRAYSGMNKNEHFANYINEVVKGGYEELYPELGIPTHAKLHAAHLAARLPLLAVMGADIQLPRMTRIPGASERRFVNVRLNVDLKKPIEVLVGILAGQMLAIAVVVFYCRKVFIRDYASHLSVARLLKTTMEGVQGMSTHTGEEITEYLDSKGVMMRYGTRRKDDGALEVDLCNDVENDFPDAMYG